MFIDAAGVSATFLMTEPIGVDLNIRFEDYAWILGTYSLAFAATLLFAGRLADLYPPNVVYTVGFFGLGVFNLIISFMTDQYAFFVLRAISAVLAVLTIPSAINMIIQMYPDPLEQAKKIGLFSMAAPLANTIALVLAGLFLLANWRWYFRFIAILVIPFAIAAWFLMPRAPAVAEDLALTEKWKRMDLIGVFQLLAMLILFILALTQGAVDGWGSAIFIAPLVISLVMLPIFVLWEQRLPQGYSLLPQNIWRFPNIGSLMLLATCIFWWFATYQLRVATWFQDALHNSAILSAVKLLPMGITAVVVGCLTQVFPVLFMRPRWIIPICAAMAFVGTMLLAFSNGGRGTDYWRYIFVGEIIGTGGGMVIFITANTLIIQAFPLEFAGVGGSFANVIFQVGGVVGIAIQTGLLDTGSGPLDWTGSKNGFLLTSAYTLFCGIVFCLWYRQDKMPVREGPVAAA